MEDYAQSEYLFGAKLDAWGPRLGECAAKGVGIYHSKDYSDNQRTEGQLLDKIGSCNIKR